MMFFSFFLNAIGFILILIVSIRKNRFSLFGISTSIFYLLFFFVAPIIQLNANDKYLVNTLPISQSAILSVNILIFLFSLFYSLSYFFLTKGKVFNPNEVYSNLKPQAVSLIPFVILLALWFFLHKKVITSSSLSQIQSLLYFKYFAMIFLSVLALHIHSLKSSLKGKGKIYLIASIFVLLLIVLAIKSPIYERRSAIGATYLTLVVICAPFLLRKVRFFVFSVFVMVFLFPLSSLLTHQYGVIKSDNVISLSGSLGLILKHFTDLHYDAWANGAAMFSMIRDQGYGYGEQLLGVLLFFVPRDIWPTKPITSGELFGIYAINNGSMWFNNLSFALPFEGYLDFSIFGLVVFAFFLALIVTKLEDASKKHILCFIAYVYISFSAYLILRGPLLSSYAYTLGAYMAIYPTSKAIVDFPKNINRLLRNR